MVLDDMAGQPGILRPCIKKRGVERAAEYWRTHDSFEMLLVTEDGDICMTEGLEHAFTLTESENNREVTVIRHEAEQTQADPMRG